jgi:hypothetical protein
MWNFPSPEWLKAPAAAALRKRASAGMKERGWNEKHFRRYQNAEF